MRVALCSVPIMDLTGSTLTPIGQDSPPHCPTLAIYQLAAVLRAAGHEVAVVDLVAASTNQIDGERETLAAAQLIAISATSLNWAAVLTVAWQIRAAEITAPIVVGGVHPTMFAAYLLNDAPLIDFMVRYEGERPLLALCEVLERRGSYADVPNLSWRTPQGEIVENPSGPPLTVEEFADLPLPAYDLLPAGVFPGLSIQSSRGCPFNCSFCSTSFRRSYRGIPPQRFVDILEGILALGSSRVLNPRLVQIVDDEWSIDRKRSIAILQEVARRGLDVKFTYDSRANDFLINEEYLSLVAPYTERFLLGAECGYDEGLKRIGKGTTVEKLTECARLLAKYDIARHAEFSFILGLPWEEKRHTVQTVRLAAHLALSYGVNVLLQWYCQIPGSELWDESWRRGDVTAAMYNEFGFFRNLHLFRSGVRLSPAEVWEVMDLIQTMHSLVVLAGRPRSTMVYRPPAPIELHFPRITLKARTGSSTPLVWNHRTLQERGGAMAAS